jgi:hypothetical protein
VKGRRILRFQILEWVGEYFGFSKDDFSFGTEFGGYFRILMFERADGRISAKTRGGGYFEML